MRLSQPWPDPYKINARSPYGWRVHPITKKRTFHHGIDVAMPVGTPLTAPADGVVVKKGFGSSGGHTLILKHSDDVFSVYYHLEKPSHFMVGSRVEESELIAFSGNTGASTGPHLHFEVRKSARWGDTVDPVPYLQGAPSVVHAPLPVDGRLNRATWKAWQSALKNAGHFRGVLDGRPGPITYRAIQTWVGAPVTGRWDRETRVRVQERLGVKADGVFGRITISELQRSLNQGRIA